MGSGFSFASISEARLASVTMPFSSLHDPADIARAQGALEQVWERIRPLIAEADQEHERTRLAYIVSSYALVALDEDDLAQRAWDRFWQR